MREIKIEMKEVKIEDRYKKFFDINNFLKLINVTSYNIVN